MRWLPVIRVVFISDFLLAISLGVLHHTHDNVGMINRIVSWCRSRENMV